MRIPLVFLKPFLFLFLRNLVKLFAIVHAMLSARLGPVSIKNMIKLISYVNLISICLIILIKTCWKLCTKCVS